MEYLFEINDKEILSSDKIRERINRQSTELTATKCKIDNYAKQWEIIKKIIHLHEYVYTSSYLRKNISQEVPISRSYFKMKEMILKYNLIERDKKYKITCLAEAPGGFIQSFLSLRSVAEIHGITLISESSNIPYWHRSLFQKDKLKFHSGKDENGDLYSLGNVLSFISELGQSSMDIVTGDGGFDYSNNYNDQEKDSLKLIYSEIFVAINVQKKRGVFICKIFDIFCEETYQLLHILYMSYDAISIYKPCISRFSNSEKYIVCQGFRGYNKEIVNEMIHHFDDNHLEYEIDSEFLNMIYRINEKYVLSQVDQINRGIDLIRENRFTKQPTKLQIETAIEWCRKYNIKINTECIYLNRTIA
jgi:23S rRNA U2552 (ribose-2'-O)-methylase RlmE/FtsJ